MFIKNRHSKIDMKHTFYILLILALAFAPACKQKGEIYAIDKSVIAEKAMVVTAHPLASKTGIDIMKSGGNAADAAIAVQLVLAVVYPYAGNLGGGGLMVLRNADGEMVTLDFREKAPAAAHRDMYLDSLGNPIDSLSKFGLLAAGVPGTVDGLFKLFDRYSKLKDFRKLIEPAIRLAENGFAVTEKQAQRFNEQQEIFKKYNASKIPFVKNKSWKVGDRLIQPDLANTLKRIRNHGAAGFYKGETADLIVAEMKKGGGIISHEDLENYSAVWRNPIVSNYKNYRIITMPPPSSGGIALNQLLEMTEPFPLKNWGFQSVEAIHLMAEAERRVYADRSEYLGDTDFFEVPIENLLDSAYLIQRMLNFDPRFATPSDSIKPGVFATAESEETTHYSIVDPDGNAISLTTTLNSGYGCKTVVSGAGFFLNNEMDDFSVKPGVPNQFGLTGAEANAIEPGKRMLSSMTPTIVLKNDSLFLVLGTPGGSTIITSVFQVFLNIVEFGMSATEAISAKRFHHQWLPDQIYIEENTFDSLKIQQLQAMGHTIKTREPIGRVEAVLARPDGKLEGAADPRRDDDAEGW